MLHIIKIYPKTIILYTNIHNTDKGSIKIDWQMFDKEIIHKTFRNVIYNNI